MPSISNTLRFVLLTNNEVLLDAVKLGLRTRRSKKACALLPSRRLLIGNCKRLHQERSYSVCPHKPLTKVPFPLTFPFSLRFFSTATMSPAENDIARIFYLDWQDLYNDERSFQIFSVISEDAKSQKVDNLIFT